MTHRLATNYAKNYCNRTPIVKVIVENIVKCFFWDTVYKLLAMIYLKLAKKEEDARWWICGFEESSVNEF